jgi:hypothetical protein
MGSTSLRYSVRKDGIKQVKISYRRGTGTELFDKCLFQIREKVSVRKIAVHWDNEHAVVSNSFSIAGEWDLSGTWKRYFSITWRQRVAKGMRTRAYALPSALLLGAPGRGSGTLTVILQGGGDLEIFTYIVKAFEMFSVQCKCTVYPTERVILARLFNRTIKRLVHTS